MLPDTIELELRAKHFENADFDTFSEDCAIAKTIREMFHLDEGDVFVETDEELSIWDNESNDWVDYHILNCGGNVEESGYRQLHFDQDAKNAEGKPPETVIRTITLTKRTNLYD